MIFLVDLAQDWVKLEENGQYRGEIYLEMTFFAAGPKPLTRRASKMPASERLWRPPAQSPPKPAPQKLPPPSLQSGRPPPANASTSPKQNHLVPPRSSRTPSPSSKLDALPPLPEEVYHPGGLPDPRLAQEPIPQPADIPLILKPGGGKPPNRSPPSHPASLAPRAPPPTASQTTGYNTPHNNYSIPVDRHTPAFRNDPSASPYPPPAASYAPINFPEPQVQQYNPTTARPAPTYPDYIPGSGGELGTDERDRLAKRYGSPLPVPGGSYPARTSPIGAYTTRPIVTSPPPSRPAPAPAPDPDPYLEREREVLSRASQEEADAEFARSLALEEGVDLEQLKREEADRELARKLARELNAPIIENERQRTLRVSDVDGERRHIPGEWNGRNR